MNQVVTKPVGSAKPQPQTLNDIHNAVAAKVPGNKRYVDGTPNQDAFYRVTHESGTLAVTAVFDGCGSEDFSHVGSHMGGRILLQMLHDDVAAWTMEKKRTLASFDMKATQRRWGEFIVALSKVSGAKEWENEMVSHFQFTVVGVIMTMTETMIFHAGDGYFCLNGKLTKLESKDNAPYYPIYPFVQTIDTVTDKDKRNSWIKTEPVIKTPLVESLILATDGAEDLDAHLRAQGGLAYMLHFPTTEALQMELSDLQRPRLVESVNEPTITDNTRGGSPVNSGTRVDMSVKADLSISFGLSASIRQGPLSDDLALIAFTKPENRNRSFVAPNLRTHENEEEGTGVVNRLGKGIGKLFGKE